MFLALTSLVFSPLGTALMRMLSVEKTSMYCRIVSGLANFTHLRVHLAVRRLLCMV